MEKFIDSRSALLIVDPQNDFCPGGTLAVPESDQIFPVINQLIRDKFNSNLLRIFVSRDWHPPESKHFKDNGGKWPVHCVYNTEGAKFYPDLILPGNTTIISKGMGVNEDGYSAFEGTTEDGVSLIEELRNRGITKLVICGLATDYCVWKTVKSAVNEGFTVTVISAACRAVDPDSANAYFNGMKAYGLGKVVIV